jgi:hypothetical protein
MKNGKMLKKSWSEMPASHFEPLLYGELEEGDKFIALPEPGDNEGHGGFRGAYNVFTKRTLNKYSDKMFVIKIKDS